MKHNPRRRPRPLPCGHRDPFPPLPPVLGVAYPEQAEDTPVGGHCWVAYCCPVCAGRGTVHAGFYTGMSTTTASERCRTCNSSGVIWK